MNSVITTSKESSLKGSQEASAIMNSVLSLMLWSKLHILVFLTGVSAMSRPMTEHLVLFTRKHTLEPLPWSTTRTLLVLFIWHRLTSSMVDHVPPIWNIEHLDRS